MNKIFISGCGDIGARVAARWQQKQAEVMALSRSPASSGRLQQLNITPLQGDLDQPASLSNLPLNDVILYHLAPPPNTGEKDPRLQALLSTINENNKPRIIVLISTTAVYGDSQGQWIDEQTPVQPETERGKRRLCAETQLSQWIQQYGVPAVILRVPGIYGPGRWPLERIKSGQPILREQDAPYTNRIHADDLAMVCEIAAEKKQADKGISIYNVTDGNPGTMSQYFKDIADAFGLPRPPEVTREEAEKVLSPGMLSYLKESRRIDNNKLLQDLGIELQYPDLAKGLEAIVK